MTRSQLQQGRKMPTSRLCETQSDSTWILNPFTTVNPRAAPNYTIATPPNVCLQYNKDISNMFSFLRINVKLSMSTTLFPAFLTSASARPGWLRCGRLSVGSIRQDPVGEEVAALVPRAAVTAPENCCCGLSRMTANSISDIVFTSNTNLF